MKANPFMPNGIAAPGMFAGRVEELIELDKALFQTRHGNPLHFLIHGERGIGKSSLMLILNHMATGRLTGFESGIKYNFIGASIEIGVTTTFTDIIRKFSRELDREIKAREAYKAAASGVWDWITNWEVAGIKYTKSEVTAPELLEDFCASLKDLLTRLEGKVDGVTLSIDEADNAGPQARLGEFVKILTERLVKIDCPRVLLGVSGISTVIDTLRNSHESSTRVLQHLLLEPLLEDERKRVINFGLEHGRNSGGPEVRITPEAEGWICRYSEGYPHFIQQYAASAFDTDTDNIIDITDVERGAFKDNGAVDQLGARYFRPMYSAQINSDEYRTVLQVMAFCPEKYVSRKYIEDESKLKKTTLGSAIKALKDRAIILAHPEKIGLYRLPTDSFALWIRMRAKGKHEQQKAF